MKTTYKNDGKFNNTIEINHKDEFGSEDVFLSNDDKPHSTNFEINNEVYNAFFTLGFKCTTYQHDLVPSMSIDCKQYDIHQYESDAYLQIMFANSEIDDYDRELFNRTNVQLVTNDTDCHFLFSSENIVDVWKFCFKHLKSNYALHKDHKIDESNNEYSQIQTSINETIEQLQTQLHSLNLLNNQPDQINNIKLNKGEFNCIQIALDSYLEEIGDLLKESNEKEKKEIYNWIKNTISKLKGK